MADSYDMIAYRISLLEERVKTQDAEIHQIIVRNEEKDRERINLERKQLLVGISFLGAMIMTLTGVIWSYRTVIFRGNS